MMTEKNLNEPRGQTEFLNMFEVQTDVPTYRAHPAIANSDLKYVHNPSLFKANKEGLLVKEDKAFQIIGRAFEDYLNIGIKHSNEDFYSKYFVLSNTIQKPGSPNQTLFCEQLANMELFDEQDIIEAYAAYYSKPDPKKAVELYNSLNDYIVYLVEKKKRVVLEESVLASIKQMYENTISMNLYNEMFKEKGIEIFASKQLGIDSPITIYGIQWKGELDYLIFDHINSEIYIVDVKTTYRDLAFFGWEIKKWKYYRQLAHYRNLVKEFIKGTKYEKWFIYTRILVAQTSGKYETAVIPIPDSILEEGERELEQAARTIKYYQDTNFQCRLNQKPDGLLYIDWDKIQIINEPEETAG